MPKISSDMELIMAKLTSTVKIKRILLWVIILGYFNGFEIRMYLSKAIKAKIYNVDDCPTMKINPFNLQKMLPNIHDLVITHIIAGTN